MKREYLDLYRMSRVCDIPVEMLNSLLFEEIQNLYMDFGQSITETQVKYEANRLKEIVLSGKYRTWMAGDVHTALQSMVDGRAGDYRKVTIQSIQKALRHAYEIRCELNRTTNDLPDTTVSSRSQAEANRWLPYIKWWLNFNVDPDQVSVDDYARAVENGSLSDLTDMWRNSRTPGPIFNGVNRY